MTFQEPERSPPLLQVTKASFGMSKPAILGWMPNPAGHRWFCGDFLPKKKQKYGL